MMATEAKDTVLMIDPLPTEEAVIAVDPIQFHHEMLIDPIPVDLQPVDPLPVDLAPVDPQPVDPQPVDPQPVDPQPVDTQPVDLKPVDPAVTDVPPDAQTFGDPVDAGTGDNVVPVDDGGLIYTTVEVKDVPADGSSDTPVDDSGTASTTDVDTTVVVDDTSDQTPVDGSGEVIGRPVDPMPNWRTLTGDAPATDGTSHDGASSDGTSTDDVGVIACVDYPVAVAPEGDGSTIVEKDGSGSSDAGTGDPVPVFWPIDDVIAIYTKDPLPQEDDGTPPMVYTMAGVEPRAVESPAVSTVDGGSLHAEPGADHFVNIMHSEASGFLSDI